MAQSKIKKERDRKNQLELFFPICHFFYASKTNWLVFDKDRKIVYEQNGDFAGYKYSLFVPFTFGIKYQREISNKSSISMSALEYFKYYSSYENDMSPGDIYHRHYELYSLGYSHVVKKNDKISFSVLGEASIRYGSETIHIYYPSSWEARVKGLLLKDVGLTLGIRTEFKLPFNFNLSNEIKYMNLVYRHDEGISFFGNFQRASVHTLFIQFGLGYLF